MQRTRSNAAPAATTSSTAVSGLNASPTPSPSPRASSTRRPGSSVTSWWKVTLSPPASAICGMCRSGLSTIRWQSIAAPASWIVSEIDRRTTGPIVTGSTKCPSPTSKWKTRTPASSSASTCAPSRAKSAA